MFVDTIKKNHDSNSKIKLSALESYSLQAQEFNRSLGFYLKKEDMNSVKHLIKSYFWKHPVEREMLVSLSHLFLNELGRLELAQFCSRLHIDIVNDISKLGVKFYNLPRVVEKLPAANFYQLIDTLIALRCLYDLEIERSKPVLLIDKKGTLFKDKTLLKYFSLCFEVVYEEEDIARATQMRYLAPYNLNFFKASEKAFGNSQIFYNLVYPELVANNITPKVFRKLNRKIEYSLETEEVFKNNSLNGSERFITFYLNADSPFAEDSEFSLEKAALEASHVGLVNWFLDQGIKVLFFGDFDLFKGFERPGFIDVRKMNPSFDCQLAFLSRALFYFGSNSGYYHFSNSIGVPSLLTHSFVSEIRGNTLGNCRAYFFRDTLKKISLSRLVDNGLCLFYSRNALSKNGIGVSNPTFNETLRSGQNMLEYLDNGQIRRLNHEQKSKLEEASIIGHLTEASLERL